MAKQDDLCSKSATPRTMNGRAFIQPLAQLFSATPYLGTSPSLCTDEIINTVAEKMGAAAARKGTKQKQGRERKTTRVDQAIPRASMAPQQRVTDKAQTVQQGSLLFVEAQHTPSDRSAEHTAAPSFLRHGGLLSPNCGRFIFLRSFLSTIWTGDAPELRHPTPLSLDYRVTILYLPTDKYLIDD